MSKIGKQPISIPEGIKVSINDGEVEVVNQKNEKIEIPILEGVKPTIKDSEIIFNIQSDKKQERSNWGTMRSLVNNAIVGLDQGFKKTLLLEGVGYRMNQDGEGLDMALGFSHPVKIEPIEGIDFELEGNNKLTVKGYNKQKIGQVAAKIRSFRPVEPYKGKGFRYEDEIVRRKAGKKAGSEIGD